MNRCPACHVTLRTPAETCPLCHGLLTQTERNAVVAPEFPDIPLEARKRRYLFPLLSLWSCVAAGVCLLVNHLLPGPGPWSFIVVASLLFSFILVRNTIQRQNSLMSLSRSVLPASLLLLLIDAISGFHRWSTNYVIPALCFSAILAVLAISLIRGLQVRDFVIYILITAVMALIPLAFLLTNLATVNWPSLVCVLFGGFSLLLVLTFSTREMRDELRRRFHL